MDAECDVKKYQTVYTFEVSGRNQEINFIELINQVADEIDNAIGMSNEEVRRVQAYGIQRFRDIN